MRAETTHRDSAGTYHSPDSALLGMQIRSVLKATPLTANSPLRVLASMLELPVGVRFLTAFRKQPISELSIEGDWLRIPFQLRSKKGYAITVPNFLRWHGVSRASLKAFLSSEEEELAQAVRLLLSSPSSDLSWPEIVNALESSLYAEGHSPVLVRYTNGLDAFAMTDVATGGTDLPIEKAKDEASSVELAKNMYPQFRLALSEMAACIRGNAAPKKVWTQAVEQLDAEDTSDDAQLVRIGFWFNQILMSDGKARGLEKWLPWFQNARPETLQDIRPRALSSRLRYMRQMIPALRALQADSEESTQGALVCAAKILQASGLFPDLAGTSRIVRAPGTCVVQPVPWPNQELSVMKENDCTPLQSMARRSLAIILVQGFQRFCAVAPLCLGDIHCSGHIVEILIHKDKGGPREQMLPIYRLAPPEAVRFLQTFRAQDAPLDIPITELAGFGRIGNHGRNSQAVYNAMTSWGGRLHMPRKSGLTFAPLRALVCRNPDLRYHPFFPEELRDNWWFSDAGLAQFSRLIPAANTDVAEVIRRIAGWKTYSQLFSSYCRTWHIQLGLLLPVEPNTK